MPASQPATIDDIRKELLAADKIVLSTHVRPDGDALGSEIGVARFLLALGKEVTVVNNDPEPRTLSWLADQQPKGLFQVFEDGKLEQLEAISKADVLLVVDTGAEHRLGDVGQRFKNADAIKLLIDHHPNPDPWFDLVCVDTKRASTGELIYELIAGHDADLIDEHIASALYAAIMTDTGSFRYGATTPGTHRIVADLLERGNIGPEPIHIAIFDGRSREGLRLLARSLDTIATHYTGRLAAMHVTQDMLRETGAYFDETEGLINYALALDGVKAAVIFLETPSGIKASFRSKGDCPINEWAAQFGGGGHANASGAYIRNKPLHQAMKEVIDKAPLHVMSATAESDAENDELTSDDLALLASFKGNID